MSATRVATGAESNIQTDGMKCTQGRHAMLAEAPKQHQAPSTILVVAEGFAQGEFEPPGVKRRSRPKKHTDRAHTRSCPDDMVQWTLQQAQVRMWARDYFTNLAPFDLTFRRHDGTGELIRSLAEYVESTPRSKLLSSVTHG